MNVRKNLILSVSSVALATLGIMPAVAQTSAAQVTPYAGPVAVPQGATQPEAPLADIIVTASKLGATSLARTAVSAEVLGGDALADRNITNAVDLGTSVAGVKIDGGADVPHIVIRGIGFDNFQYQAENGVASYINGVLIQRTQAQLASFLDLERVDVLKGPQGTSFGRNATGGAINYVANRPVDGFSGAGKVGIGSFSRRYGEGFLNYGTDQFGIRVAAQRDEDDGYGRNLVTGNRILNRDNWSTRLSVFVKPTDSLRIDYFWQHSENNRARLGLSYSNADSAAFAAGLAQAFGLTKLNPNQPFTLVANRDYTVLNRFDEFTDSHTNIQGLTAALDLGSVKITSITGYLTYNGNTPLDTSGPSNTVEGVVSTPVNTTHSKQFSQELFVNGDAGALKYVAGFYYLRERADNYGGFSTFAGLGLPTVNYNSGQFLHSKALYVDGQYNLSSTVRLNAGLRYTWDYKRAFGTVTGFIPAPLNRRVTFQKLTGHIGAEADINDTTFGYLTFSRGYKSGGINSASNNAYLPEAVDNFEAGIKGSFLDRSIRYTLTGFYMNYKGVQVNEIPTAGSGPDILNAEKAQIAGLEASFTVKPVQIVSFDSSLSWQPLAKYTDFNTATFNYKDVRLSRAPRISGVSGINIQTPLTDRVRLHARAEVYYTSSIIFNQAAAKPINQGKIGQGGYALVNGNIAFSIGDNYEVNLFARNLTKTFYYSAVTNVSDIFQVVDYGRPREFGAEFRVKF